MGQRIQREDDLDDESYQSREVYAQFGLTIFLGQILEQAVINGLTMAQQHADPKATRDTFDARQKKNRKATFGQLINTLEPYMAGDAELITDLKAAVQHRNLLAHHFFSDHAVEFMSIPGRELMLAELVDMQHEFQELDPRLKPVIERYLRRMGITVKQQESLMAEAMDELSKHIATDF